MSLQQNGACSVQWQKIYHDSGSLKKADQGMPDLQNMLSPLHGQPDPLDLGGSGCFIVIKTKIYFTQCLIAHLCCVTPWRSSCVTIVMLVMLLSLRYGCRDPNYMVNVIRCAALDLRTTNENLFLDFLERLRGWQNNGTKRTMSSEEFQSVVLHMNDCHDMSDLLGHS